jgi:hypothetical protein
MDLENGLDCPLRCGSTLIDFSRLGSEKPEYHCPACGRYRVTATVERGTLPHLTSEQKALLPFLRAHTRQSWEAGRLFEIYSGSWEQAARGHVGTAVPAKLNRLLTHLGDRSSAPGDWVALTAAHVAPLLDAANAAEVEYLLEALVRSGTVETRERRSDSADFAGMSITVGSEHRLTPAGWEALAPISGSGRPGTCLVAMAFDSVMNDVYDSGIKPAVEADCGFVVERVDRIHFNESINDRIIIGIRSAQFVVADVTLQKNGVYFEGGFAMGLGRPVIWTVRDDEMRDKKVHFDTSHLNHVVWTDPDDLRKKLAERIQATIPGARILRTHR